MKKLAALLLCLCLPAWAADIPYTSTTGTGAQRATLAPLARHSMQCDVAVWLLVGDVTVTSTSATGVKVAADTLFDIETTREFFYASVIPASGTAVCKFFRVTFLVPR